MRWLNYTNHRLLRDSGKMFRGEKEEFQRKSINLLNAQHPCLIVQLCCYLGVYLTWSIIIKPETGHVPRRQCRKTLNSPPPTGIPKLQLLREQLSREWPEYQLKRFSTTEGIKKGPNKMGRRGRDIGYNQGPHPQVGNPQMGESAQLQRFIQGAWVSLVAQW